jgi:hypothetical protein
MPGEPLPRASSHCSITGPYIDGIGQRLNERDELLAELRKLIEWGCGRIGIAPEKASFLMPDCPVRTVAELIKRLEARS